MCCRLGNSLVQTALMRYLHYSVCERWQAPTITANDGWDWWSYFITSLCFKNTFHKQHGPCETAVKIFWKKKKTCRNQDSGLWTRNVDFGWTENPKWDHNPHILLAFNSTQNALFLEDHKYISYIFLCLLLNPYCNLYFCCWNCTLVTQLIFKPSLLSQQSYVLIWYLSTKQEIGFLTQVIEMRVSSMGTFMHLSCLFSALSWIQMNTCQKPELCT